MHTSARTFGITFAASLGLHGLLLLATAGLMTVMPVWQRQSRSALQALNAAAKDEPAAVEPPEVEVTFLNMAETPAEEKPPEIVAKPPVSRPSGERMIYAPEDRPALAPLNADTPFVSSQNMRAASTSPPTPGADPNLINQDGHDLPLLSLRSSAFAEGGESPAAVPATPPSQAQDTPPPANPPIVDPVVNTPPASAPPRPDEQRPPEPQATMQTNDPLAPAPPDKPAEPTTRVPEGETPSPQPPALREPQVNPVAEKKLTTPPGKPRDPVTMQTGRSKPGQRASLSSLKTKSTGAVAEQGEASVDARDTPEGRYGKAVHDIINPIWNRKLAAVRGLTGVGVVEVSFEIDVRGTVGNVRLVDPGKANPVFEDVCLTSIIQAKLPPPPAEMQVEMRDPLSNGKLRRSVSFFKQY